MELKYVRSSIVLDPVAQADENERLKCKRFDSTSYCNCNRGERWYKSIYLSYRLHGSDDALGHSEKGYISTPDARSSGGLQRRVVDGSHPCVIIISQCVCTFPPVVLSPHTFGCTPFRSSYFFIYFMLGGLAQKFHKSLQCLGIVLITGTHNAHNTPRFPIQVGVHVLLHIITLSSPLY